MFIVGLTGGIATGKSLVSKILKDQGVAVIDADEIARNIVAPGLPAYHQILAAFGDKILKKDGEIDRKKLSNIIFTDENARILLNHCTHPYIRLEMLKSLLWHFITGKQLVVMDIPLLFEGGLHRFLKKNILVYCKNSQQMDRLQQRDAQSEAEATRKISAQMQITEKIKLASYLIDNTGSQVDTAKQVKDWLSRTRVPIWKTYAFYIILIVPVGIVYILLQCLLFLKKLASTIPR